MGTVIASEAVRSLLGELTERTEVRDSDGKLLGYFTPQSQTDAELYARARKLFDPVELEHRVKTQHGQGYTIDEVMRRLESLGAGK